MPGDETIISSIEELKNEGDKKPYLTFIKGPRLGQIHALRQGEILIGRSPDCDLWVEDSAISRKHFQIRVEGKNVQIRDLGSTNGTYVNGEPVKEAFLNDGDKIQISQDTMLELTYLDESQSLSEKKLYEMGVIDPVTNIHNKRYLMDRLKEEFSYTKRRQARLSMILFDIDHFKKINDTYGHLAGDLVLQKICAVVSRTVRTDDVFARYGGEEFVIVMRETEMKSARELAERIRQRVGELEIPYEKSRIRVTISCGLSEFGPKTQDPLSLIAEADAYLYRSKRTGRNRVTGPDDS